MISDGSSIEDLEKTGAMSILCNHVYTSTEPGAQCPYYVGLQKRRFKEATRETRNTSAKRETQVWSVRPKRGAQGTSV